MTLPEPARSAWLQHRDTIKRLSGEGNQPGHLMLGGGTILAARWKHRLSTDIDVLLPDRETLNDALPNGPNDLAAATGGQIDEVWRDRIKVRLDAGMLDVCAMKPQLPGLEEEEQIEGRTETILSSAQILRGKLYRTHRGIVRDAFDLTTAAKAEPRALQLAVNALTKRETLTVCKNLMSANERMAAEAEEALYGVAKEYQTDLGRLGHTAAMSVLEHRYTHVLISTEQESISIETQTKGGSTHTTSYTDEDSRHALTMSGINWYLSANTTVPKHVAADALDELRKRKWSVVVLDSRDSKPTDRLRDALAMARRAANLEQPPDPPAAPSRAAGEATMRARHQQRSGQDR